MRTRWSLVSAMILVLVLILSVEVALAPPAPPATPNPNPQAFIACQNTAGHPHQPPFCRARTWVVTAGGPSTGQAARLAAALGLPEVPLAPDGVIRWLDAERFQFLPTLESVPDPGDAPDEDGQRTIAEALDLPALAQITILSDDEALARADKALRRAGLLPPGARAEVGHSILELLPAVQRGDPSELPALPAMSVPLDTHVSYHLMLGGLRLIGPGAKVKIVFDGAGHATQVHYALRSVAPGPDVAIVPPAQAEAACAKAYRSPQAGKAPLSDEQSATLRVAAELVYFAPPLSSPVRALYPHFLCSGRLPRDKGADDLLLRDLVIPAVLDTPAVQVTAAFDGLQVTAQAKVSGGTPPYTFQWSAVTTTLDPAAATAGSVLAYTPTPRQFVAGDEVTAVVTDANGLTGSGSAFVSLGKCCLEIGDQAGLSLGILSLSRVDVGTEWIGVSMGLDGSAGNAAGWVVANLIAGVPVEFNWGNFDAFERDFKDELRAPTGDDHNWIDNVDMVFYTGHANGNGWQFPGTVDDGFLHFSEARYGNRDLEWLIVAACGPLQETSSGLTAAQRWGPAFDRLHILLAYATVSGDNTVEGHRMAGYMHGGLAGFLFGGSIGPRPIRQAWAQTATDVQGPSVIYGMMGPISTSWNSNYNDYFWGRGPTTGDIFPSSTIGYWIIRAPS